ncbi:DUF1553 domain-containing protein [Catalinimonas niigatensis]|uniref:DUF1553 domain-containing protein n=1 Tax=Catalinimonas niigatensis TaxID=1397264 RepID=UPI002665EA04|nr:DUF1553 domain-containing protein [Catalinimonas niigatensis]WPP48455.1 DUF1553 domain-containing protein [Catalinimonas niigatensis]
MPGFSAIRWKTKYLILPAVVLLLLSTYLVWEKGIFVDDKIDFNAEIRPILNKKCITCHGGVKRSGEFSLLFRSDALGINESGKRAIVPGSVEESEMIRRITHHDPEERMPPEGDALPQEEIELLTRWIEQGAYWEDHWAYIKPEPVEPPALQSDWIQNEIDKFVLQRLQEEELQPSSRADKATLLRRVSLDLSGLPPTPTELEAFLADSSAQAYEKVVDRLLASPRYGERWTAMWMDLARYADSKGYEKDGHRNIWKYRDWVIRSFNEDKPFDQFTIEQLAGDLLPNPTDEQLIATAFHRNTMNNDEGGTDDEEFRVASVIDRVNTTWDVWQATTIACVQCHSHPYDPIRHEEYYQFYAFLNNTADADVPSESPTLKQFKNEEDGQKLEEVKNWVIKHTASADEKLKRGQDIVKLVKFTEPKIHPHYFDQIEKGTLQDGKFLQVDHGGHARIRNFSLDGKDQILISYLAEKTSGRVEFRQDSPEGELLAEWKIEKAEGGWGNFRRIALPLKPGTGRHDIYMVFKDPGRKGPLCTIEWTLFHQSLPGEEQAQYPKVQRTFLSLLNTREVEETPVMIERPEDFRRKTHVFVRGNWLVDGEEVAPDVPKAWPALPEGAPKNRLSMAQWMVSTENPLTARVTVNRLWAQLFGTGIVETVEDFGTQGAKPSHPELLDWLAIQFMHEHQWSIKKLLKQMVMSATYQQSSKVSREQQERDPANQWLARGPRVRLNAEQIRDQTLAVSGLLSDKMYGPSVMPPQPEGIWQVVYSGQTWETSEGEDQYRRGLYTYWRRTSPYPSMITFDSPSREFCMNRRIPTNTPLQALVTLNDPVYMEAARSLAQRMLLEGGESTEERIETAYKIAMLKPIADEKKDALLNLYDEALTYYQQNPEEALKMVGKKENQALAALTVVANAIMNLDEFVTKG